MRELLEALFLRLQEAQTDLLRVILLNPNLFPLRQRSTESGGAPRREEATPRSCHDPMRNEPSCHF